MTEPITVKLENGNIVTLEELRKVYSYEYSGHEMVVVALCDRIDELSKQLEIINPPEFNKYLVTYYYLATGMEGNADTRVEGEVEARDEEHAKDIIIKQNYSDVKGDAHFTKDEVRRWVRGCLKAHKVF